MFFVSETQPYCHTGSAPITSLPHRFGLLCWNVHKSSDTLRYRDLFRQWHREWNLNLLLLQEARMRPASTPFLLPDFSYCSAPNLRLGSLHYGLLTASSQPAIEATALPSRAREGVLGPGKGSLITRYRFSEGRELTVVNLHGINFRASSIYARELDTLKSLLEEKTGPLIVAGDFNSWSATRMRILETFRKDLEMQSVSFPIERIKKFRGYPLDHILYRDLLCERSVLPDLPHDSDHNPLLVEFSVPFF